MCQSVNLCWKIAVVVVVLLPSFVTETKIIFSYNFGDPLKSPTKKSANWKVFELAN